MVRIYTIYIIKSAINDYKCSKDKAFVLEFGANIDDKDIDAVEPYRSGELRILFSGTNWKRKGCDIAIDTVRKLNERGIKSTLYLLGIDERRIPANYCNLEFVKYLGFLNKNLKEQYNIYLKIFQMCHCLLLPTHAECSSIVLCEAAAFGLPSFTYDTGGLSNYVINGVTGYRLDIHSTANDFANIIEQTIKDNQFEKLHKGALSLYKDKISWSVWSRRFSELMVVKFNKNK